MDVSNHFRCDVYSAHFWEHGAPVVVKKKRARHPLADSYTKKDGSVIPKPPLPGRKQYDEITTYGWVEHMVVQYANTSKGRVPMNIADASVNRISELFGKQYVEPMDPVSWFVDGDTFILDMFMNYSPSRYKYDLCNKKHVRLYIDRGQGSKVLGWENWDSTITKLNIDRVGNVALVTMEDKKRKRRAYESESESELGDDSDFSEDEDGYAIPKRDRKVVDTYRVKKTIVLSPQEFATGIFNEHEELHFFVDAVRKVMLRPRRIGLLTLCKMLIKVRRLRYQAIGRKWAPGGSEYMELLKCDTAQVMSAPCTQFEVACM